MVESGDCLSDTCAVSCAVHRLLCSPNRLGIEQDAKRMSFVHALPTKDTSNAHMGPYIHVLTNIHTLKKHKITRRVSSGHWLTLRLKAN